MEVLIWALLLVLGWCLFKIIGPVFRDMMTADDTPTPKGKGSISKRHAKPKRTRTIHIFDGFHLIPMEIPTEDQEESEE